MDKELMEKMAKDISEATEKYEQLRATYLAESTAKEATLAAATAKTAELEAQVAELTAKVAELEAAIAEKDTAVKAAMDERDAALAALQNAEQNIAELRTVVDEVNATKAAEAKKALLESRIASLPESYRKAHLAKSEDERSKIEARWIAKSDDEWASFVGEDLAGLAIASTAFSFLERSRNAAPLPTAGEGAEDAYAQIGRLARK